MGYTQLPITEVRIEIPDLIINNTIIKREAYYSQLKDNTDSKTVCVDFIVQHFATDENNQKGEYIGYYIADYIRTITATNDSMCDLTNGVPIDNLDTFEGSYTGQYDFFTYLRETQPILINQYLRNFGLITDWSKK